MFLFSDLLSISFKYLIPFIVISHLKPLTLKSVPRDNSATLVMYFNFTNSDIFDLKRFSFLWKSSKLIGFPFSLSFDV